MKKTVIITGGSKGIGAAIATNFSQQGYIVFIGSREAHDALKKSNKSIQFYRMDVRQESDHIAIVKLAMRKTGRLDVYINCAGFSQWKSVEDVDQKFWNDMIDTNLKGTFWGCKTASKFLSKKGSIINVSSLAGKRGSANNSVYCASKFGVTGLTQSLAKELGAHDIRVNAVCPVYVTTQALLEALEDNLSPAKGQDVKSYLKKFALEQSALKRLPTADEIARVCLFLASDDASAITGQSINVDCGVLPQ